MAVPAKDIVGRLKNYNGDFNGIQNDFWGSSFTPQEAGQIADAAGAAATGHADLRHRSKLRALEVFSRRFAGNPAGWKAEPASPASSFARGAAQQSLNAGVFDRGYLPGANPGIASTPAIDPELLAAGYAHTIANGPEVALGRAKREAAAQRDAHAILDRTRQEAARAMAQQSGPLGQAVAQAQGAPMAPPEPVLGPRMNTSGQMGGQDQGTGFDWHARAPAQDIYTPQQRDALVGNANQQMFDVQGTGVSKQEYARALRARQIAMNAGAPLPNSTLAGPTNTQIIAANRSGNGPQQLSQLTAYNPKGLLRHEARSTVYTSDPEALKRAAESGGTNGLIVREQSQKMQDHNARIAASKQYWIKQQQSANAIRKGLTTPEIELAKATDPAQFQQVLAMHHPEAWAHVEGLKAKAAADAMAQQQQMDMIRRMDPAGRALAEKDAAEAAMKAGNLSPEHYPHLKEFADSLPAPAIGWFGAIGGTDHPSRKRAIIEDIEKRYPIPRKALSDWYDKTYGQNLPMNPKWLARK